MLCENTTLKKKLLKMATGGAGQWAPFAGQVPGKMANVEETQFSQTQTMDFQAPVFAGIDLGTTFFGYAFSFKNDADRIYVERGKEREPTCLLLKPDKTLAALGHQAVDECNSLDPDKQKDYYYFRQFKMELYETKKLSRKSELKDATGKQMKALDVFCIVFCHLKQIILHQINLSKSASFSITSDDVGWMITIPAIWTDEARQFMREAATNAGLTKIRLVLEPEAAALYAINQPLCLGNAFTIEKFGPGSKYIVADLGGGTVDMCVHEILDDGNLRELYRATGGYAGGSTVNDEFLRFLKTVLGEDALEIFAKEYPHAYQDLQDIIEDKKCRFTNRSDAITMNLDTDLMSIAKDHCGKKSIEDKIAGSSFGNAVSFKSRGNLLKVDKSMVKKIFQPSVEAIIQCLKNILTECAYDNISTLLLVGGYSESDYLRDTIQTSLPDMQIIKVEDGRLAVVKGAVMMATKSSTIIERRSRFTYGFIYNPLFIEGVHPPHLKYYTDGEAWCGGVFEKLVEAGEVVHQGQQFSREGYITYKDPELKHTPWYTELWRSPLKSPTNCFLEEDQCELVGRIEVAAPPAGWPDEVNVVDSLVVGETELTMKLLMEETGEEYETTIDFL